MWRTATYDVTETLRDDKRAAIYRGLRVEDHHPVIIKVLGPARKRPRDRERLRNGYDLAARLASSSVVRPIAFEPDDEPSSIVFDDYGGASLDRAVELPMEDEPFLELAIRIAAALADIHGRGVVHKDIKPANILVHPETGEVRLTDFELASLIPREHVTAVSPQRIEGSLPYMSPEQTGRTHHAVDHRTDLYSLGVTLYQLRSGRLPLEGDDALGFLHAHLAMVPRPLQEVAPGTPAVVSDVVGKLLAKDPEDRYASALGVQHDLQRCLDMLRQGRVEPFPLGERDATAEFRIPERLYGRQREVQTLLSAFDRVAGQGRPSLVLVSGYAGIGKSALVEELYGPVVRERGLFLRGKFDQFRRGIPYSTIAQAFGGGLRELATESAEVVARWRARLREALGINARLVVDLIPELAPLVDAPPVANLPLAESERRFRLVLRQFLSTFADKGRPVALFLDDLQWADSESLDLIEDVLTHPDTHHLLIVGAYRDNEVSPSHPLMAMLDAIQESEIDITNLVLAPLSLAHVRELVTDTVHTSSAMAAPLARLIHEKTAGNPFFTVQLMTSLHEQKLLAFDPATGAFRWDLAEIQRHGLSGNVVDLMIQRLSSLPPATQETLKIAACIGDAFDLETTALVRGESIERTQADLWEALRSGAVLQSEGTYRFLHDRVHEAASSMTPEDQRSALHLRIGRILLAHTPESRRADHVFQIVSQLNQAIDLIEEPEERTRLAELNLQAATKARASAAYRLAVVYCSTGIDLLPGDAWHTQRPLAYALLLEQVQSEYLNQSFERAELLLSDLIAHCETVIERAAPYCVGIQLYAAKSDLEQAVGLATEYLRLTGFDLSMTPTREAVGEAYRGVLEALGDRPIEDLAHFPAMTDPEKNALMTVLSVALPATLFVDDKLWALLICHGVQQSLQHGTSAGAPVIYASFAVVSGAFFGRYQEGYRFGKLALALLQDRNRLAVRSSVSMLFGYLLSYWVEPIEAGIPHLERSVREGVESGNITYACYSAACFAAVKLTQGLPLAEVEKEGRHRLDFVRRMRFAPQEGNILTTLLFVQHMRGSGDLDEAAVRERVAMAIPMHRGLYLIRELELHVLFGRFPAALAVATRAEALLSTMPNFMQVADYAFFHAIALARSGIREGLVEHERRLVQWAEGCPTNFDDRAALVSAEVARLGGRESDARALYERAIHTARKRGRTHVEALAYELAAEFYEALGYGPFARAYREEARNVYQRWGALAKVHDLEQRYPALARPPPVVSSGTFTAGVSELNLLSVAKASQSISSEIVPGNLARTLLRVVLEQSGAQRGCLILVRDRGAAIMAEALARDGVQVSLHDGTQVASSVTVPRALVERVLRTGERAVIEDAAAEPQSIGDTDYAERFRPKSVLCIPILRQDRAVGCLYLENLLVTGSFTPERLGVLDLLASQAAISLDNAHLLERELEARRAAEQSRERAAFLAEVGSVLSESLDLDVVLERVARAVVRSFADWIAFDLVEDGQIRRRAGAHRYAERAPLLEELARRYPPNWDSPHPSIDALRSGRSMLVPKVTDDFLSKYCVDTEHQRLIRELGTDTGMIVPLRTRNQVVGILTIGAGDGVQQFGPSDLELSEELARRAAMAIDNATHYKQARDAVRQRDEFLSIASHELRTPVTSLLLATQAMREHWKQGDRDRVVFERSLNLVERQGRRLADQIGDLLDITRIGAGKLLLERSDTDLVDIIREVLSRFEHELSRAKSPVSLDAPAAVRGDWDAGRLTQVVSNLVSNAVKFGGGRPIEITVTDGPNRVRFAIEDHGIGFDPSQHTRIFDRYVRAASARHFGGLGLGLYICRQIVDAHGGSIIAESTPGAGARFIVELPRRLSNPTPVT